MSSARLRVLITACGLAVLVSGAVAAVSAAGETTSSSSAHRVLIRCVKFLSGDGTARARALPGSADPQVAAELSILRAPRTSADTLPVAGDLTQALAGAQATSYDPSASVLLNLGVKGQAPVYAVPAVLAAPAVPAACLHLRSLAGFRAAFALRSQETGSGPGICVVSAPREPIARPVSALPGRRRPGMRPATQRLATAGCESLTTMASYLGTLGGALSDVGTRVVILPDGVSSVSFAFADGRRLTGSVAGNLLTVPPALSSSLRVSGASAAKLRRALRAAAPVTVTETGAMGTPVASFTRPPGLIGELVREVQLLRRAIGGSVAGSSSESSVSCSARTHRCVAVVVTDRCTARNRCRIARRIVRYRYAGRRPPRGTSGPLVLPTAPIRARVNRYVTRPGKISLVLSGAPHRRVRLLTSFSCSSTRGGAGTTSASPVQSPVAVPSRTLLVRVRRHRACDVGVLVVSAQPGAIHARLARG